MPGAVAAQRLVDGAWLLLVFLQHLADKEGVERRDRVQHQSKIAANRLRIQVAQLIDQHLAAGRYRERVRTSGFRDCLHTVFSAQKDRLWKQRSQCCFTQAGTSQDGNDRRPLFGLSDL